MDTPGMVWVLAGLVVLLCALVGGCIAVLGRQLQRADQRAEGATEAAMQVLARREPRPKPIVVPAPDLTPYLDRLSSMAVDMAREVAQGVSLIVQGPPGSSGPATAKEPEVPDNPEDEKTPVWYPPWEQDETWGIDDGTVEQGEWSAHTGTDAPMHDGTGTYTLDGTGAPIREDGQRMFGGGGFGIWPPAEAG